MSKELKTAEDILKASGEMCEIFDTMAAVKGQDYTAIVRSCFGIANFHQALEAIVDGIECEPLKSTLDSLLKIHEMLLLDTARSMIKEYVLYQATIKPLTIPVEQECQRITYEIGQDILVVDKKQREYDASVFPTAQPPQG